MSTPKRYIAKLPWYQIETQEHPAGEFVLWQDYAALAAENERLRNAGDVTIAAYCMGEKNVEKYKDNPVVAHWLAAKEGRDAK